MKPLDIENVMREHVGSQVEYPCSAPPIPQDLEPPSVVFTRTGGSTSDLVVDSSSVMIHCYGSTWADAMDEANEVAGAVKALPYLDNPVTASALNTLPYNNYDPQHPDVPRVSFSAIITTRSERG